ncbi:MAG TPA: lipoprotein insertase outer membrane protein LolB [Candidatus Dormibacteraeota bacterium]|nr:lipoprotein insertase outer membrane protein LolB [Candidatus Dormibacteraeota bacterium]
MRSSAVRAGAIIALAVLAGCRTAPQPVSLPAAQAWETRKPELQASAHFELRGRVAIATGHDGFNANLRWAQDGAHSQLTIEGPLGVGAVQVSASGDDLSIVAGNGTQLDSVAAHRELAARLGFDPPLASLRYWVLGVPDPSRPATEEIDSAQQRLRSLSQDGWRIDYPQYLAFGAQWLPSRLTLQREAVRVRMFVDDWQL